MQRKTTNSVSPSVDPKKEHKNPDWGRAKGSFPASLLFGSMILFCPVLPLWFYISCNSYDCAVIEPGVKIFKGELTVTEVLSHAPAFSWEAIQIGFGWLTYQLFLAVFLPGPTGYGQLTPAGNVLAYKVNGLNVWILTHILFGVFGFWLRWFEPTVIYDNWGGLLIFANIWGFALTIFAFVKAYTFPTHPADRKFSGYLLYDLFWGIEFNPRIGPLDFKLFMNGRPGICAWTLINLSFAAAQFRNYGYVTNSMLIVNLLHAIYVVDFFYNEDWYLRTIDIAHDHFGFMLAWGDSVWLPFTYTVQGFYLVTHPVQLSTMATSAILGLGFIGYYIFRAVNYQKDHFRSTDGKCTIWGKPAEFIDAKFSTSDGKQRSSKLLVSGWWGVSRHFNYVGDLCISLAYCLPCGFTHILPYFYIIFMTCLLVERTRRDDGRLTRKYGSYWAEYKKKVPWAIFPYIW